MPVFVVVFFIYYLDSLSYSLADYWHSLRSLALASYRDFLFDLLAVVFVIKIEPEAEMKSFL